MYANNRAANVPSTIGGNVYFVIRKNKAGQFWWRAVGDNNEIMAASELMTTKQSCKDAIAVVQTEAASAKVFDKTDETKERNSV